MFIQSRDWYSICRNYSQYQEHYQSRFESHCDNVRLHLSTIQCLGRLLYGSRTLGKEDHDHLRILHDEANLIIMRNDRIYCPCVDATIQIVSSWSRKLVNLLRVSKSNGEVFTLSSRQPARPSPAFERVWLARLIKLSLLDLQRAWASS